MYYCDLKESTGALVPIAILLVALAFYLLGTTADGYLSPALE